jgi:amidase
MKKTTSTTTGGTADPSSSSSSSLLLSLSSISPEEILSMDAIALSNAIQNEKPRRITCEKLMKITLDHIDKINPKYNAIILLRDRNELLEQAKECDQALLLQHHQQQDDGNNNNNDIDSISPHHPPTKTLGWLHGIPTAIKDLSNVKGLPTTNGGSPLSSLTAPASTNDLYVEHMINDGVIIIGKTNVPEYGLGSNTYNDIWGYTLNPFAADTSLSLSAGGSSGGAAVAISTNMISIADGTDNMGSLRNPAGWNNIYSLRPTSGFIPTTIATTTNTTAASSIPMVSASSILPHPDSTPGPMARTPLDCALLLQTMVGNTERFNAMSLLLDDNNSTVCSSLSSSSSQQQQQQQQQQQPTEIDTIMTTTTRIGWLGDWQGHLPFEDGILIRCRAALEHWSFVSNNNNISSNNIMVSNVEDNRNNIRSSSQQPLLFSFGKLWDSYNTIRFA